MSIIETTDYKADKIKGKQRACGGKFGNALGQTPWMSFEEEIITEDAVTGSVYHIPVGGISVPMDDPSKILTLRNPLDDSIIGESTLGAVQAHIYSLYRQVCEERDALILNPPTQGE